MQDEMIMPDQVVMMGNGKISTLTNEEIEAFDEDDCNCSDCLNSRIEWLLEDRLDSMVEARVFAILDDIFGDS